MKPSPSIKWPGSKWRIADWIIEQMPSHDCYLEPFFGSGAVFFSKPASNVETINDRDSLAVNLFSMIRENPLALAQAIELTPWARAEYDICRCDLAHGDDIEKARRLMVVMWQSVGLRRASTSDENSAGSSGWRSRDSRFQSPVRAWQRLPERIQAASKRLLSAQIENRCALEIIARHDSSEVLIYADPPYVHSERNGRRLYAHEMSDAQHVDLLDALKSHPGPVLLSGYANAIYDEHLDWAHIETETRIQNNLTRTETLWMNPLAASRMEIKRTLDRPPLLKIMEAA